MSVRPRSLSFVLHFTQYLLNFFRKAKFLFPPIPPPCGWSNHNKFWVPCALAGYKYCSNYPAIPLPGIHTEEIRSERDTCTSVFIAALFIIARTWKQPRCPPADEWIRKLWYIYTMEYYSAIKKNSFESVLMRWMNLEPIIQSEVSQKDKDQYSILTHIYGILKDGNDNPICKTEKETQM